MRKFRRVIASLSMVAILSSFVVSTTAFAGTFDDVPADAYYYESVEALAGMDVVDSTNANYNPATNLNRAESATLLANAGDLTADLPDSATFADVPMTEWFWDPVETAYANGVVSGYSHLPGYYGPYDTVTREQFAKMAVEAFDIPEYMPDEPTFPDVTEDMWSYGYVETAYYYGVINGNPDGTFAPTANINRADGAVMTYQAMNAEPRGDDDDDDDDVVIGEGDVTVTLNDNTPDGATLPSGATSVKMATWDFTAGDEDAVINSIQVHRYGVSTIPTDHKVYLYDGSERLTSGKNVNSTTNVANFNNLNYEIAAGDTLSLTLRMDVGTVGSVGELGYEIESADSVDAGDGSVSGSFPVKAEKFDLSTTAAGTVTVQKNGTVTDAKVGEKGATVAKFKISATTEAASLEELGLYVGYGSINTEDVENFKLYASGMDDPIAEVDMVNSRDVAQFVLDDPYEIEKGDTRSFWATAEFNTGRTGDTFLVYIDETTDVVAVGGTYGFGMTVDATAYDGSTCTTTTPTECNAMTLEGGDVTISGTNITNRNIAVNQDDVAIMQFTIVAATDVTFDEFGFHLDTSSDTADPTAGLISDATGTPPNFTDIKISEVDGSFVWGPVDADSLTTALGGATTITEALGDTTGYYVFTDDLYMEAGESRDFEITLDVANETALADSTITATLDIDATYPKMKDVNNKTLTNSSSLVPTSDYAGDAFTVKSDNLTVARSASIGSSTQVVGTDEAPLLALSIGAGDASDVKITSIKTTGYIDDNGTTNLFVVGSDTVYFNEVVLGMNLYEESISEDNKINSSPKAAATNGEAVFDNLSWDIPAGETKTLIVAGELSNNSAYDTDQFKVDIADVSADIVAENDDGNSVESNSSDGPNGTTTDSSSLYTQITMSAGGTLAADIPSSTPSSQIVVAGTDDNNFSHVKFTATDESFVVNKLALKNDYVTTVGDYDDNLDTVKVRYYTDEEQTEEEVTSCSASATNGVYVCTGMNMMVPDPDLTGVPDYAVMYVESDLNDVADSLADEGDKPNLTLSLTHDFEATGQSSGKKIEEAGTYDLTITDAAVGNFSDTVTGYDDVQSAEGAALTATDTTLTVDDGGGADPGDINMVGAFLCLSDNNDTTCDANEEIVYVKAVTDGAASDDLTIVRGVNGTTGATLTDNDAILVIPPSTGLITNYMQVQATDITLAAAASSRSGSTAATEEILTFTATADDAKDAEIRQGKLYAVDDNTGWTNSGMAADAAETTTYVSGNGTTTGSVKLTEDGASATTDYTYYDTSSTTDMGGYSRVSFWIQSDAAKAAGDLEFITDTETDLNNSSANEGNVSIPALTANQWKFVDSAITGYSTSTADRYFGINIAANPDNGAVIYVDEITFYDEKVNVDLKLNENWASATPTVAYLKQDGSTVATAYVDFDGVTTSKTGQVTFVPTGTYPTITISGTNTFTVELDTATAVQDDATATEKLTATVDLGNVSTPGDFYWYDGSSSLNFLGVNSTDKISTVTNY